MLKGKFLEMMAKQTFESPQFKQSWANLTRLCGPILEPAFPDNFIARIHLCVGLNQASAGQLSQGLFQLQQLEKHLKTDADRCAYYFALGLSHDIAEDQEKMIAMYTKANEFGHKLHLPYVKVAQYCQENQDYEQAAKNYRGAIGCFSEADPDKQNRSMLAGCHRNLASCLIKLNRCDEAEEALNTARRVFPEVSGIEAVEEALRKQSGPEQA